MQNNSADSKQAANSSQKNNTKKQGLLFIVSGPSGVGKSTIIEKFLKEDNNSVFSVSYTTRKIRKGEADGKNYYFVNKDTFKNMIEQDGFLEWENVYENLYGTPKKEILETLGKGMDVILDIDIKGALNVKRQYPEACLVFIEPPSKEELIKRLSLRGEKDIAVRTRTVEEEIAKKSLFEYTVINNIFGDAYRDFTKIIQSVRGKKDGKNNC
jgi:guanylate kinase